MLTTYLIASFQPRCLVLSRHACAFYICFAFGNRQLEEHPEGKKDAYDITVAMCRNN
jgi:hypothetical protein